MNRPLYKAGLLLHLGTILPAGLLVIFQFIPIIRYKLLVLHRINGYVIVLLLLASNAGALIVARHAFGGTINTQIWVGVLVIATTFGATMAYINIKRLQIEEHRAWMIRTWVYAASIVTLRLIMIITTLSITNLTGKKPDGDAVYHHTMPCSQILYMIRQNIPGGPAMMALQKQYPGCFQPNTTTFLPAEVVAVRADFNGNKPQIAASMDLTFGAAGWLALLLHAIGVEIYLRLTPREHERLRKVSYQRQLEAGFSHPGSAGLVKERIGDAEPWVVPQTDDEKLRSIECTESGSDRQSGEEGTETTAREEGL